MSSLLSSVLKRVFVDQVSKIFSWTPTLVTKESPLHLKVYVVDTLNATSFYWPELHICACNDVNKCLFDVPLTQAVDGK